MRVSVVIPAHNREKVIARAIRSVIDQTYPVSEIIIVDDGSTDHTASVAIAAANGTASLRILTPNKRLGAAGARNFGASSATGEVIAFLDSDDEWLPNKLEKQVPLLEHDLSTVAVFSNYSYCIEGKLSRSSSNLQAVSYERLLYRNCLGTSTGIVRKITFNSVNGFCMDLPCCEDWDLWIRIAKIGRIEVVKDILAQYHFDGGGRLSASYLNVVGHKLMFQKIYDQVRNPSLLKKIKSEHLLCMADVYSRQVFSPLKAVSSVCKAIFLSPKKRQFLYLFRIFVGMTMLLSHSL